MTSRAICLLDTDLHLQVACSEATQHYQPRWPVVPRHDVYKMRSSAPPPLYHAKKGCRRFAAVKLCTRKRTGFTD